MKKTANSLGLLQTLLDNSMGKVAQSNNKINFDFKKSEARELSIELATKGRDIKLEDIDVYSDKTLEYKGKKVILYIRDQFVPNEREYKFHISWCEVLQRMKENKRLNRYVVSNREDGKFNVNELDTYTKNLKNENVEKEIKVCVNCLGNLTYNGFIYGIHSTNWYVKNFNIKSFFSEYDSNFNQNENELNSNGIVPLNKYCENWNKISRAYRKTVDWKCEKCGENLSKSKGELEVHHINRNKFNVNKENLIALCHTCHEKEHENDY